MVVLSSSLKLPSPATKFERIRRCLHPLLREALAGADFLELRDENAPNLARGRKARIRKTG
eukprot:6747403-Pyramimonas_sp.AAC.1